VTTLHLADSKAKCNTEDNVTSYSKPQANQCIF